MESRSATMMFYFQKAYQFWLVIPTDKQTKYIWQIVHWGADPRDPVQRLTEAYYLTIIS